MLGCFQDDDYVDYHRQDAACPAGGNFDGPAI